MNNNYRYIVYMVREDRFFARQPNMIADIIAICKSEEKAKQLCESRSELDYTPVIWEE